MKRNLLSICILGLFLAVCPLSITANEGEAVLIEDDEGFMQLAEKFHFEIKAGSGFLFDFPEKGNIQLTIRFVPQRLKCKFYAQQWSGWHNEGCEVTLYAYNTNHPLGAKESEYLVYCDQFTGKICTSHNSVGISFALSTKYLSAEQLSALIDANRNLVPVEIRGYIGKDDIRLGGKEEYPREFKITITVRPTSINGVDVW